MLLIGIWQLAIEDYFGTDVVDSMCLLLLRSVRHLIMLQWMEPLGIFEQFCVLICVCVVHANSSVIQVAKNAMYVYYESILKLHFHNFWTKALLSCYLLTFMSVSSNPASCKYNKLFSTWPFNLYNKQTASRGNFREQERQCYKALITLLHATEGMA